MRHLTIFLLCSTSLFAQYGKLRGPHRPIMSGGINCGSVAAQIVESKTDGVIGIGASRPTVVMSNAFLANDVMLAVAVNNGGTSGSTATIADAQSQTWIPIEADHNQGIWYAVASGPFANDSVTVTFATQSLNRSLTITHLTGIPSLTAAGADGTYSSVPSFTLNASSVTFAYPGVPGSAWSFGGLGVPSTASFSSGLVLAAIVSYNGTSYNPPTYPPTPWTNIVESGLPSAAIAYTCH